APFGFSLEKRCKDRLFFHFHKVFARFFISASFTLPFSKPHDAAKHTRMRPNNGHILVTDVLI
ncbi:MAG: hypothetical protein ACI4V2_08640, partial [Alloprevotella sp.]